MVDRPTLLGQAPPLSGIGTTQAGDTALALNARTDRSAFAELCRRHLPAVYRYLLARTGRVEDAQDLTEETFLAALEGIGQYRGQGEFLAWLIGIARHKVARHRHHAQDTLPPEQLELLPQAGPPVDVEVERRLALVQALQALPALTPDRADALALRIYGELSVREIATLMGKSDAAVKMLIYRAVRDLRGRL